MMRRISGWPSVASLALGALILIVMPTTAKAAEDQKPYAYKPADLNQVRNAVAGKVQIMPTAFLREYDPLTLMYNSDMHPAGPGPQDDASAFISLRPVQPGEYRWLDPRTLEFRPSVPWKPMQSYTIKASGETKQLTALLSPPQRISPEPGVANLAPFSRVELEFAQPVAPAVLAKLVTFEVSTLPGNENANPKIYGPSDYHIKTSERSGHGAAIYTFVFNKPFANGQRIRTVVRLAENASLFDARRVYYCDTRKEFALERAGTYEYQFTLNGSGSSYGRDQAIRLGQDGALVLDFSANPASLSLSQVKSLLNFSPAPRQMDWSLSGTRLTVKLTVDQEKLYNVVIAPVDIRDTDGRKLQMQKQAGFFCYQPLDKQYARWPLGHGLVERIGPQHFPLLINGIKSLDLRVYKIDPLHKAFWPFPNSAVAVDESQMPPGPGEEPAEEKKILAPLNKYDMAAHIRMLGSPHYSAVIDVEKEGIARYKNIDLKPILAKIAGTDKPGSYLVGFRTLDGSTERSYVRIQATDLALSTVESKREVLFTVTSMSTGKPIAGAEIRIEVLLEEEFKTLLQGKTDAQGMLVIQHADVAWEKFKSAGVKRVVVKLEDDVLALDTRINEAPPEFANNHWYSNQSSWLEWLSAKPYDYTQDAVPAGFVFTERPIYRPDETVYFKGFARSLYHGEIQAPILSPGTGVAPGSGMASGSGVAAGTSVRFTARIQSPAGLKYEFPVKLSSFNSFNDSLVEKGLPTGDYNLELVRTYPKEGESVLAQTGFKIDAYRIPKFEIKLHGPEKTANDRPVSIKLNAAYYAGGKVAGQPVAWKVVSYPFAYTPEGLAGYLLSSDSRYGAVDPDRQQGALEQKDVTDDNGQSVLAVNPQSATAGNPRKYVCEATVTDVDEQTVSNRITFLALPPFVLAMKVNRHITGSASIKADIAAMGIDGKFAAGHKISVQLKKMSWTSYLQETDFSVGKPKYRTQESVDLAAEKTVTTAAAAVPVEFPNQDPGVYIVEISARDRLGRMQSIQADVFLAGNKPVTWKKTEQLLFETVPDKAKYAPGDAAHILLKSPFQKAVALAVIERPGGTPEYHWVDVNDGQGTLAFTVTPEMAPKIPVSFLLMRARISDEKRLPDGTDIDAGRPQTLGNTTWLIVDQAENTLKVALTHAGTVRPGAEVQMGIDLKDSHGTPQAGEVALWLVDQAVLSLAKEKPLDPLPAFTAEVKSHISMRDGRNMIMGDLRVPENPGGDGGGGQDGFFGKVTVRKNFKTVPYWNPAILVDKSGKAVVTMRMSDDLTDFAVRAVAVSGQSRFGVGVSEIKTRLPVIVQPAMPRFVRPGDRFRAGGVARLVEGTGGEAAFKIEAQGLKQEGDAVGGIMLAADKPSLVKTWFTVPDPGFDAQGKLRYDSVGINMAVERKSDHASDAFNLKLPIQPDRPAVEEQAFTEAGPGKPAAFPALAEAARPGTLSRQVVLSDDLGILKALSAMTSLVRYPFDCAEQRISRSLPALAYRDVWAQYGIEAPQGDIRKNVANTLEYLGRVQTPDGLIAYWPGSEGYIHLTAYAVEFLSQVKAANANSKAGYPFDDGLYRKAMDALKRGIRSDFAHFVDGYAYAERTSALLALADAGELDVGYARELAATTSEADLQSQARVYAALTKNPGALKSESDALFKTLWAQTVFRTESGKEVFAGLQQRSFRLGARVHQNEITALAGMVKAFSDAPKRPEKLPMLVDELVRLGDDRDWGNTQANSLALLALRDYLAKPQGNTSVTGGFSCAGTEKKFSNDGKRGAVSLACADAGPMALRVDNGGKNGPLHVHLSQRYIPMAPGSEAPAIQKGFVVQTELVLVNPAKGDRKLEIAKAGQSFSVRPGDIIEEHVRVENPKDRAFVAVTAPFAAGLEFMNPRLETSGTDAKPNGVTTQPGDYQGFMDDHLAYYFENMAAGTYDFYFRLRATTEGEFTHPSARAEMMYDMGVFGSSPGAKIVVKAE